MNEVSDSSVRGVIFDVQRGSFHDGPGIRTTVFLKGCLLRCGWCHNPESWSFGIERLVENGKERVYGREVSAGEVLAIVARDRDFFRESGGGLTLSGGEPSQQLEFCLALLRLAHAQEIHTCLDTCGFNRLENFLAFLPHVDLFLWDYKIANPSLHKELTGEDNHEILENLDALYAKGARILLRCPILPGINDTPEHFGALAELSRRYPNLKGIELLPYHDAGRHKFDRLGLPTPSLNTHPPTPQEKRRWFHALEEAGCIGVIDPR